MKACSSSASDWTLMSTTRPETHVCVPPLEPAGGDAALTCNPPHFYTLMVHKAPTETQHITSNTEGKITKKQEKKNSLFPCHCQTVQTFSLKMFRRRQLVFNKKNVFFFLEDEVSAFLLSDVWSVLYL